MRQCAVQPCSYDVLFLASPIALQAGTGPGRMPIIMHACGRLSISPSARRWSLWRLGNCRPPARHPDLSLRKIIRISRALLALLLLVILLSRFLSASLTRVQYPNDE